MIAEITKQDNQLRIYDSENKLLESFYTKDNLQRALELLKQLNSIKTANGIPIYKTRMFNGISVWSFHQHVVFWNSLVPYTKYEAAIKFLIDNRIRKVVLDSDIGDLTEYLRINRIEVASKSAKDVNISSILSFFLPGINKLIGVMVTLLAFLKLLIYRFNLLVYTPDKFSQKHGCDFRFYAVYEYMKERGIRYVEVFHTLLGREFLRNMIKRKRPALYLECLPLFPGKPESEDDGTNYELSVIEPHNREYFLSLLKRIDQGSQISIKRIQSLARLLKFTRIKVLIAIDDVRYTNELIAACRLNGIKTYGFQHGHFTKYHVGWMNYGIPKELSITFDKLFVWNEYWQKVLLSYSTQYDKNNVELGGVLRELEPIDYKKKRSKTEKVSDLSILVPYETFAPKREVGEYMNRFIELGIKVFFKLRPDVPYNVQFDQYNIKHKDKVEPVVDINEGLLAEVDAIAGVYSTFLNEILFYEKPVLIFDTSLDLGHQLIDDGLALLINRDLNTASLLDYINNRTSKKAEAWPSTEVKLKATLSNICEALS